MNKNQKEKEVGVMSGRKKEEGKEEEEEEGLTMMPVLKYFLV